MPVIMTLFVGLVNSITIISSAGGGATSCTGCSSSSLRTLSVADAVASGLASARSTSTPITTVGTNLNGCTTLLLRCPDPTTEVVGLHLRLNNAASDYGNYGSGLITLDCNAQGQWVAPTNNNVIQHQRSQVVDGYSCVSSAAVGS